jgi:hypothetical protein
VAGEPVSATETRIEGSGWRWRRVTSQTVSPVELRQWRPVDALFVLMFWLAASTVGVIVAGPKAVEDLTVFDWFGIVAPAQALGVVIGVAVLAPRRAPWREALAVQIAPGDSFGLIEGAGLQIILGSVMLVLVEAYDLTLPTQEVVDQAGRATGTEGVAVFVALVVLAPLSEELLFRGVLLRSLLFRYGKWPAIVGSAGLFALIHLLEGAEILHTLPVLFVLGLVLGHSAVRTGRLGRAVTIHAGFNLITTAAVLAL